MKKILADLEAVGLQIKPTTVQGVAKKLKGQIGCPNSQYAIVKYFIFNRHYYESN